jgi:hypothetical protein
MKMNDLGLYEKFLENVLSLLLLPSHLFMHFVYFYERLRPNLFLMALNLSASVVLGETHWSPKCPAGRLNVMIGWYNNIVLLVKNLLPLILSMKLLRKEADAPPDALKEAP